jgi:hypothetical protein
LLSNVEDFNASRLYLPIDPKNYRSNVEAWPQDEYDDTEGAFGFALLGNMQAALRETA